MALRFRFQSSYFFFFFLFFPAIVMAVPGTSFAGETTIPPGTTITMHNWTAYRDFMPDGMQALFEGHFHWKMPPDFRMVIGPTTHYPLPPAYSACTERYSNRVKIVDLPNGEHIITGYVCGLPFPDPSPPKKGYKILADDWYKYVPHVICGYDIISLEDRFNNLTSETIIQVYRRHSHIADPGEPINDPKLPQLDYSEFVMVTAPEQAKYTAQLTLYYTDLTRSEDVFLFVPALRRTLRLSTAARCSPVVGTDLTQDDARDFWNGGIARFDAHFVRDRHLLSLPYVPTKELDSLNNLYMPVFFPKPSMGKWQVRGAYEIDVRRIPQQRAGYCYGKRILYVDKEGFNNIWGDLYDSSMKYWKSAYLAATAGSVPDVGMVLFTDNWVGGIWDMQNGHFSGFRTTDGHGHRIETNQNCKNYFGQNFDDDMKYSTIAGLNEIER